jgi:parallel beta-helix repeat protein
MRSAVPFAFALALASCSKESSAPSGPPCTVSGPCTSLGAGVSEDKVQEAFATAKQGQTILFGEGTFKLSNTLALAASNVTVRGAGVDKTILDFSGQKAGSEGIFAESVKSLTFEGFTVRDTKGNSIKVLGVDGVVFRKVKGTWTGPDSTAHGAYGLYPVQSKNVLIEDCIASGASDSGIYVGQSDGVVVRRNEAFENVAGIEIENTFNADVYENKSHDNTGGVLVFDLPGLQQKGGHGVRVHDNVIENNNTDNFAPFGNVVGLVPRGTGFFVMANHDVEVFKNTLRNNLTAQMAIISYLVTEEEIKDASYYPYPARISFHDNTIEGGGTQPDAKKKIGILLATAMAKYPGNVVPGLLWDGIVDDKRQGGTPQNPMEICIKNNGSAAFANLHLDKLDKNSPNLPDIVSFDATPHDCSLPAVPAPSFPGL